MMSRSAEKNAKYALKRRKTLRNTSTEPTGNHEFIAPSSWYQYCSSSTGTVCTAPMSACRGPGRPAPSCIHLDCLCCQVTEEAALRVADAQRAARPQVRELKAADRRGVGVEQHALDVPAQIPHLHPESRGRAVARRSSRGRPSRWRPSRGQREKRGQSDPEQRGQSDP